MHGAPSVSYPVGRSRFALMLAALAWLAGAGVTLAWARHAPATAWQPGLGAATVMAALVWAAVAWWRSPAGLLAWDGEGWRWADGRGEAPGRLRLALDLQRWLLVQWRPDGARGQWLWLERQREPGAWLALRRAVYSPASTDTPRSAPAAAKTSPAAQT